MTTISAPAGATPGEFSVAELRRFTRWCVWRWEQRGGKPVKRPYGCGHTERSSTYFNPSDPTTWLTWEQAAAWVQADPYCGFGYVLGDLGNGWTLGGIDLDCCLNASGLLPWGIEVLDSLGETYRELSPSGNGIKALFLTATDALNETRRGLDIRGGALGRKLLQFPAGDDGRKPAAEVYFGKRFFALTWRMFGATQSIGVLTRERVTWLAQVEKKWPASQGSGRRPQSGLMDGPVSERVPTFPRYDQQPPYSKLTEIATQSRVVAAVLAGDAVTGQVHDTSGSGWGWRLLGELIGYGLNDAELDAAMDEAGGLGPGGAVAAAWWAKTAEVGDRERQILRARERAQPTRGTLVAQQLAAHPLPPVPVIAKETPEDPGDGEDWWSGLQRLNTKGAPLRGNLYNVGLFMTHHPALRDAFVYNEFAENIMVVRQLPFDPHWTVPRLVRDEDAINLAIWLQSQELQINPGIATEAITSEAHKRSFDPVRMYLDSVQWDGVERLPTWLRDHLGVAVTAYTVSAAAKFLISAVARVFQPGCKVDTMLILEGTQGIYKSAALRVLFGNEYFTDQMPDLYSKDAPMQLAGHWCVEFAELHTLNRTEAGRVKSFLSTQFDTYRKPFARTTGRIPRRGVLAGTMNTAGKGYFTDETGNRRFWPVACTVKRVDLPKLQEIRDQLWAEAVVRYRRGENWWLSGRAEELQEEEVALRYDEDVWTDQVQRFLEPFDRITVAEVLRHGLGKPTERQTQLDGHRVARILRFLGWNYTQKSRGDRTRYFIRPGKTLGNANVVPFPRRET